MCVVHWHCTAQMSMFNMEKRFRNKIIIIIIIIIIKSRAAHTALFMCNMSCVKWYERTAQFDRVILALFYWLNHEPISPVCGLLIE